jgi:hypothetical protein
MSAFPLPVSATAQSFFVQLVNVTYKITLRWNTVAVCWVMDLADSEEVPLVQGIPIVTGTDLLAPYRYLGIGGGMVALTEGNPDAVPTFENLGAGGDVFFIADE